VLVVQALRLDAQASTRDQTSPKADSLPPSAYPMAGPMAGSGVRTVRADSLVPVAPVFQLPDLIAARLPGVEVQSGGGQTGDGARLIMRGVGSIRNGADPVVYVDGVRVSADPGGLNRAEGAPSVMIGFPAQRSGRMEDLAPSEIERIDVLTGPAATTRYGIDAVNGVVLVTTKSSTRFEPEWSAYAEGGVLTVPPASEPNSYFAYGTSTGQNPTTVHCPPLQIAAGACTLDSIAHFSPLSSAATNPLTNGSRDRFGLQVRGGIGPARYFVSADHESEVGILAMPASDRQLYEAHDGFAPLDEQARPNALDRTNIRANVSWDLRRFGTIAVSANAIDGDHRAASEAELAFGLTLGTGSLALSEGWQGQQFEPRYVLSLESPDRIERYITGATWSWNPAHWLTTRATAGLDHANAINMGILYALDDNPNAQLPGYVIDNLYSGNNYTSDLVATATAGRSEVLSAATSVGVQYRESNFQSPTRALIGFFPGTPIKNITAGEGYDSGDTQQRGAFIEEALTFRDRLFLTGAVRADETRLYYGPPAHAFYPRAALSWTAVQRGVDGVRVHTALGESGDLPTNQIGPLSICLGPCPPAPPVSQLRPEHVREVEAGADATALETRLTVGATVYDKTTGDAILLGSSTSSGYYNNSGRIRNRGVELTTGFDAVRSPVVSWSVGVGAWTNTNRLISGSIAGNGLSYYPYFWAGHPYSAVVGGPVYAIWQPTMSYHDANGDGIIEPDEVSLGPETDQGSLLPTRGLSFHSTLGFARDRIRVGALIDYSGGNRLIDENMAQQIMIGSIRGANDPRAPLAQQAEAVAASLSENGAGFAYVGPPEDASFVRFRELTLSYSVTPSVARLIHTGSAVVSLAARNLWLWTRYTGPDPEIDVASANPTNTFTIVPQPRYFVLRVSLGY